MAMKNFAVEKGITIYDGSNEVEFRVNSGSPEGIITAPIGSICLDTLNGDVFKKKSGADSNGWELLSGSSALEIFDWKASVISSTTVTDGNINLASYTGTIDGVALVNGGRYLIKNQTDGSENGIYTWATGGVFTRSTDADSSDKVTSGMAVPVSQGTENDNTIYILTTNDPIVLDTTVLSFTSFGVYVAGNGITISGSTVSVKLSATGGLEFNGSSEIAINVDSTNNSTLVNASNEIVVNGYGKKSGTTTSGVNEVIDSVSSTNVSSVEWLVTIKNGTTGRRVSKVLAVYLGSGTTIDSTEFGIVRVGSFTTKPEFDVVHDGATSIRLIFNGDTGLLYEVTRIVNA